VLVLKGLTAFGLIDHRGSPNLVSFLVAVVLLQFPLLALMKAGLALLTKSGRVSLSISNQINLLCVPMVISVVAFLKTAIPYFEHNGNGYGVAALACTLTFTVLCVLVFRAWHKLQA
jgi:hypothetical protein